MDWVLHDNFKTKEDAQDYGKSIILTGVARGAKIVKSDKKGRPYLLYIMPLENKHA